MTKQLRAYNKIAQAIDYIEQHFKQQPSLDEIAASVHLSPYHFQRMFTQWAGVSPKKFMQFLSIEYAKKRLSEFPESLLDTALQTGLSGASRLHDLFINIEGMTPGDYKNGGAQLVIEYHWQESLFGAIFTASTDRGVCHVEFVESIELGIQHLSERFPNALLIEALSAHSQQVLDFLTQTPAADSKISLHIKGTAFQLKVWQALLQVPQGSLASYSDIAQSIGSASASRAVATAIANNNVAFLIPCHRVIKASGHFGQYRWGETRKLAIIAWEGARECR